MQVVIRRSKCVLMLLLFLSRAAVAQDLLTVSGAITTRADGMPVSGAVVSVVGADASATTDSSGRYTLQAPQSLVRGDRIQVKVDALGLPPKFIDVAVHAAMVTVDVALSLGFEEQVTVGSGRPGADAEKAVPVDMITQEQIASRATPRRRRSSRRSRRRSTSRGRRSPTAPIPCDLRRCGAWGPTRCSCSINGKRRHQSALVHLNGSIGRGSTGRGSQCDPDVGDRAHRSAP